MAIEVLIRRVTKPGVNAKALLPHIVELRSHAVRQPGYISGETLFNLEQIDECLVISRWTTIEHWQAWNRTSRRIEICTPVGGSSHVFFWSAGKWIGCIHLSL